MSERHRRPRGIRVGSSVYIHDHGATVLGRSQWVTSEDARLAAAIDELGGLDTFGVSRLDGSSAVAVIDVPLSLGRAAILTQDLWSGRWSWHFPALSVPDQHVVIDVPASDPNEPVGAAARLLVKVIGAGAIDGPAGAGGDWSLERWERIHRRSAIVSFPQAHSPHTVEVADLGVFSGARTLLLLHDVFGTTSSSFGEGTSRFRSALNRTYGERVLGFDHATLTSTPKANAERLEQIVRDRQVTLDVDIVGVGRGGLVAAELAALRSDYVNVDRVVFVGTPLRGTPLPSNDHVETFIDRYTNLISLTPDSPVAPTVDAVCALALHLAGRGTGGTAGLTAMAAGIDGELPAGSTYTAIAGNSTTNRPPARARRLDDDVVGGLLGDAHDDVVAVDNTVFADVVAGNVLEGVSHRDLISDGHASSRIVDALARPGPPDRGASPAAPRGWNVSNATTTDVRRYTRMPPNVVRQPMELTVVHGTIALQPGTVMVGHYLGTSLTGTEAAIDARTRGRMSLRHLARLYPESIGDAAILPNSVADGGTDFPRQVLIIGLGPPGELTRSALTDTVTSGLLRLAILHAEHAEGAEPQVIDLATPLMGAGGLAPLPAEASITGIVDGVLAANSRLREMTFDGRSLLERVRFGNVRFVELQEDVAEVASRTVTRIAELVRTGWRDEVELKPSSTLKSGAGGWPRRLGIDEDATWHRVLVRQDGPLFPSNRPTLTFTLIGRSAATGEDTVRPNVAAITTLLAHRSQGAAALFRLLVPRRLRHEIAHADNLHFIVDEHSAAYPWEALITGEDAPGDEDAMSRRAGFIRQFIDTQGTRGRPNLGDRRRAVIIGDPPAAGFPPLRGAADEVVRVRDRLERYGYTTVPLPARADAASAGDASSPSTDVSASILRVLSEGGSRILHIAAHGTVDENDPDRTGVVIGPDSFLTADDVRNFDDVAELVFLNCCHLAAAPALAANLARAFMQSGSQAVIAAGWPVADDTAARFADRFYLEMLEGASFGSAVRQARRAAFSGITDMTWAAYQCYGDPGYRLERQQPRFAGTSPMVSPTEFLRAIGIVNVRASDVGRRGGEPQATSRAMLRTELQTLHDSQLADDGTPGGWLDAVAFAALGDAAFQLGEFQLAIEWYKKSLEPNKAIGPVRALEQLGNAEVRYAAQLARQGEPYEDRIADSLGHLEAALALRETTERLSLLGSHWKKRAVIAARRCSDGEIACQCARDEGLANAVAYYGRAKDDARADAYPGFLWIQLAFLRSGVNPDPGLEELARAEARSAGRDEDFWVRAAAGDASLTRLVIGAFSDGVQDAAGQASKAADGYRNAFELRSSWRERDSVLEHIRDLIALSNGETCDALKSLLAMLLDAVRELGQDE